MTSSWKDHLVSKITVFLGLVLIMVELMVGWVSP